MKMINDSNADRTEALLWNALTWIWEHTQWSNEPDKEYATILKNYVGMTQEEFNQQMEECGYDVDYEEV